MSMLKLNWTGQQRAKSSIGAVCLQIGIIYILGRPQWKSMCDSKAAVATALAGSLLIMWLSGSSVPWLIVSLAAIAREYHF